MSRRTLLNRLLALFAALLAPVIVIGYLLIFWPLRDKHPALRLPRGTVAIQDATVYVSPDQPPLHNATLLARDGRIVAVGGPELSIPPGAQMIPCQNCTVTAGFWNMHVHFTEPKWNGAAWTSKQKLNKQLADMLTSHGFTTVVDLGSDPRSTISLRRRIEEGELSGPLIYTAGPAIYPENGVPYYVRASTPPYMLWFMAQPGTAAAAKRDVQRSFGEGADVLKLFTGAYVERGTIKPMRVDVARAAVQVAHGYGTIAFAHPSNLEGVQVALASGVDVLAHTPDTTEGIDDPFIAEMAKKASMIPTLKMFATTVTRSPTYLGPIYNIVRRFRTDGGNLLFGTDVGYMADYATRDEYEALAQCGLTAMDILRMLTVAPAARMGVAGEKGTLSSGKLADFVVLDSDPAANVKAFDEVRVTVRSGKIVWQRAGR